MSLQSAGIMNHAAMQGNQGHQVAINGFIAWLLIMTTFAMYFLWAFLPVELLDWAFMHYHPDKYWAAAVPAIIIMTVLYYLSISFLLLLHRTNPLYDGLCVSDTNTKEDHHILESLSEGKESVPPIADIPVSVTSKLLFQPWN